MKTNTLNIGYKIESSNKTQEKTKQPGEENMTCAHPHGLAYASRQKFPFQ